MNNFPQKFKLFKTKKRIKSRKASDNFSLSSQEDKIFQSPFIATDSNLQSLEKSVSLTDNMKSKADPTFPRYSLIAFFNPTSHDRIITHKQSRSHQKYSSEDVRRWDLPEGYIEKMRTVKASQNHSKLLLKLNFDQKHKTRKQLFMKTIQNMQNIESGKLKDLIMRKYRKSVGANTSQVGQNQLHIQGFKRHPQTPEETSCLIKGSSIRTGSPLKVSRRRNVSSRGSVVQSSCLTTLRRNSFLNLEPWQIA